MSDNISPAGGHGAGGDHPQRGFRIPISQDIAAGIFLMLVGLFFIWQSDDLPMGTLRAVGPGMLPRAVAIALLAGGAVLALMAFLDKNAAPTPVFTLRGPLFIIGGILLFAVLIRSVGLIVAGPASMIFASYASPETKIVETTIFSVVMTALCIGLFKYLLNLPIPVIANYW